MEHYQSLYKDTMQTPRQHNHINRRLQEANRNKSRQNRYLGSRNISVSPQRHNQPWSKLIKENKKENENLNELVSNDPNVTRLAKILCKSKDPVKLNNQEAFLKRFIEWKQKNKEKEIKRKIEAAKKQKPYVSAVFKQHPFGNKTESQSSLALPSTIVPSGHENFKAPLGLKNPIEDQRKEKEMSARPLFKSRQSLYTVVSTPPSKNRASGTENNFKKLTTSRKMTTPATTSKNKTRSAQKSNNVRDRSPTNNVLNRIVNCVNNKLKTKSLSSAPPVAMSKDVVGKPPSVTKTRAVQLKMPPPTNRIQLVVAKNQAKPKPTGAANKIRQMQQHKQIVEKKTLLKKKSPNKSTRLGQSMKSKKPPTRLNGKKLLSAMTTISQDAFEVVQTPIDFSENSFEDFVTSTKIKKSIFFNEDLKGISPIEPTVTKKLSNSSCKRTLIKDDEDKQTTAPPLPTVIVNCETKPKNKFNFIRYSVADTTLNENDLNVINDEEKITISNGNKTLTQAEETLIEVDKTLQNGATCFEKTPTKNEDDKPANYLSPYITCSRGKVSMQKERQKRNSIYLAGQLQEQEAAGTATATCLSPQFSVEIKRILEAVKFFRKQLHDETERLLELCNVWDKYKEENLEKLLPVNGDDMINVAVGQTRLLTSKKFMQFKGLIDRCESGATGIGDVVNDGSEATKPISSEDLEGFWSMLGLQVDNLEKRFHNLERWKANDWQDPDEAVVEESKPKKKLTRVKKSKAAVAASSKARPNSALQQMLRKMQAEKRQKSNTNSDGIIDTIDIQQTSSSQQQQQKRRSLRICNNNTPRRSVDGNQSAGRISVIVRDRKSFSAAATVVSIPTPPNMRRRSRTLSQESPKHLKHINKFKDVHKSSHSSDDLRKSVLVNGAHASENLGNISRGNLTLKSSPSPPSTPAPANGRKSILKTPGTAKSKVKNIIFNEKIRVKKFKFIINDGGDLDTDGTDDANVSHEEDLEKNASNNSESNNDDEADELNNSNLRTYGLRNRKVRLRPENEIAIPT